MVGQKLQILLAGIEMRLAEPLADQLQRQYGYVTQIDSIAGDDLGTLAHAALPYDVAVVARSPLDLIARLREVYPNIAWITLATHERDWIPGAQPTADAPETIALTAADIAAEIAQTLARTRSEGRAAPDQPPPAGQPLASPQPGGSGKDDKFLSAFRLLRTTDDVYTATCRLVIELFEVDHCGFVRFDLHSSVGSVVAEYPAIGTLGTLVPSQGVLAEEQLIASKQPICIARTAEATDLSLVGAIFTRFDIRSILIVPIVYQNRVIGSFSLDAIGRERTFTADEIDLCMILAQQIAAAMERTSLLRQPLSVERFKQFSAISTSLLGAMELDHLLSLMAGHIVRLVGARRSLFLFVDMVSRSVIKATGTGFSDEMLQDISFEEVESGLSGWVLTNRQPLLVENAQTDPRNTRIALKKAQAFGTASLVVVPLLSGDQVLGTLTAINDLGDPMFTSDDLELVVMLAQQAALAIRNTQEYQETIHRQRLLSRLDEVTRHVRAEKGWYELQQEVARLGVQLAGAHWGGLAINHPRLGVAEVQAVYRLPATLIGTMLGHGEGLIGLTAQRGKVAYRNAYAAWSDRERCLGDYPIAALAAIPLKHIGETEAVLFVGHQEGQVFSAMDIDVLERFTIQASLALHTAHLLTPAQRRLSNLAVLHQISDYIQSTDDLDKILRVVLTGITAGYGLGFNRAAMLLINPWAKQLEGRAAIGELTLDEAVQAWREHAERGLEDFPRFVAMLERGQLAPAPLDARVRTLRMPINWTDQSIITAVLRTRQPALVSIAQLDRLPRALREVFEPSAPLVVVPLVVRAEVIGLLVADDKFSGTPITPERQEMLMIFANTAAVAIDNWQLFQETSDARRRLRSFYSASTALVFSRDPERLPHEIVDRARVAAEADGVTMILIDASGWVEDLIATGGDLPVAESKVIRPSGISMQVMRTMKPVRIEDAATQMAQLNPSMIERKIGAALCLPIVLEGACIGVLWIHYHQPRTFTDAEIDAAQLYVNQAAIAYDSARRMRRLERMRQAAEALSAVSGLPAVLSQIGESARAVFQADSAMILAYDAERRRFIPGRSEAVGIPRGVWEAYHKEEPRRGGTAYTILDLGYVNVNNLNDVVAYPFLGRSTRHLLDQIGARSFQGVRLSVGEDQLGVLYINYHHPHSFHAEDVKATLTFANHAALALKTALLLDQVNRAQQAARVVAGVMALEGDLYSTLKAVVDGTFDVLGCDAVTIYVYDQQKDYLYYPPIMRGVNHAERVTQYPAVPRDSIVFKMLQSSELHIAEHVASDRLFGRTRFAREEGIHSCVAIPLRVEQEKVGVAFVNYRTQHRFTKEEEAQITLFANQASVAIRNAHLAQERQRQLNALQAIYRAGRLVKNTSLTLEETLGQIIKEGLALIDEGEETGCSSHLALVDEETQQIRFTAAYPPHALADLQASIGSIDLLAPEQIGITGRAIRTGQPQNVPDVALDPDYICHNPSVRSELAVPIKDGNRVIGSINMKHHRTHAFSEEDVRALETLAGYAAVAIQNARLYGEIRSQLAELQQTKKMLDAQTAVAWMGIVSSAWRHTTVATASTIRDLVTLIENDFAGAGPPQKLTSYLQQIKSLVHRIQTAPITGPLASEKSAGLVPINSLLRERIARRILPDETFECVSQWKLDDSAAVWSDFQWLRQAFDLLIDNAVEAMVNAPVRRLTITTQPCPAGAEVLIADTGPGIPPDIKAKLFRAQIEKPSGSRGMGMGLLIAQTIIHAYRGEIEIVASEPSGTTMCVRLPLKASPY